MDVVCDLDTTPTRHIRRAVRDLLADRDGVMVDDAALVLDELVSNAHVHGAAPRVCRIGLLDQGHRLRFEVDDTATEMPRMRTPDRNGGRGLVLVDRLSSSWGVQTEADHKSVWAELALDSAGSSGHARHMAVARDSDHDIAPRLAGHLCRRHRRQAGSGNPAD